jgi:HEAT repeat protein
MKDSRMIGAARNGLADATRAVRAACVDALAAAGDRPGLLAALASPDIYLRQRAAAALAEQPGVSISMRLAGIVFDPHPLVRCAAADAWFRRGGPLATPALWLLARDQHNDVVRHTALAHLARRGSRRAHARLIAGC